MSCLVSCDLIFITRPVDTRGAGVKLRGGVGGKDERGGGEYEMVSREEED